MNNIFGLVNCLFPPPPPIFFFFLISSSSPTWLELIFFLLKDLYMFTFTCNVSLHCIHTKSSKYYIHLQKKKNYTNLVNVYNICQFLCVYNINLHCKCNVYFYI